MNVSTEQLAGILHITARRVRQLSDADKIPKAKRNGYKLEDVMPAYIAHRIAEVTKGGNVSELDAERTRLTAAKADAAEIEAALLKDKVHDANAVETVWADMLSTFRSRVLAIPVKTAGELRDLVAKHCTSEAAAKVDFPAVQAVIEDQCREALQELSEYDPSTLVDEFVSTHSRESCAAAETDDEPVGGRESSSE